MAERRYYNVVLKAVIEDLMLRLYEQSRGQTARRRTATARTARPSRHGTGAGLPGSAGPGRAALALAPSP